MLWEFSVDATCALILQVKIKLVAKLHLVGLVKYTLANYSGRTSLAHLAAATAQSVAAVKVGIEHLRKLGIHAQIEQNSAVSLGCWRMEETPKPRQVCFEIKNCGRCSLAFGKNQF